MIQDDVAFEHNHGWRFTISAGNSMADQLYLNLWFPSFNENEIRPRLLSVLKQFPFSASLPGISYAAVHPISWAEPVIFAETFDFRTDPENAVERLREYVHADYAYVLDAAWDLWTPVQEGDLDEDWRLSPQTVRFVAHGISFDEGTHQDQGHIQVDFGLDTPFLHDEAEYTPEIAARVKANIQKLVMFTQAVEKNTGITGRVLWSESDENLAQKLIAKLQKVN
jgi:hypothetical protein